MEDSLFTKIIRGQLPCEKVYEDERVFAFLDIYPLSRGHTLVIPKAQVVTLDQLSDDDAAALGRVLPRIARAVLAATGATAFNVLQNNGSLAHQAVPHVHFHVIPKYPSGEGLGFGWSPTPLDRATAPALATAIAVAIRNA